MTPFSKIFHSRAIVITGCLLCLFFVSCSKDQQKKTDPLNTLRISPVHPGQIERFHCLRDTFFSYTAYTPQKYSDQQSWPVLFIFDPHAQGFLPVRRYHSLADEYGYILIASNDSKNGLSYDHVTRIFSNLMNDSRRRWKINDRRQYLLGFSGGARLAAQLIADNPELAGIICCGAGFNAEPDHPLPFVYAGLTGIRDFNYAELRNLDDMLDTLQVSSMLIEFDGGHEWPPAQAMRIAYDWLEVNAMRQHIIPVNETRLNSIVTYHDKLINEARANFNTGKTALIYRRLIRMLNGLSDIRDYQEILSEIERYITVKNYFRTRRSIIRVDVKKQAFYRDAFSAQTFTWWAAEIKRLKTPAKEKPADEYQAMNQRHLQYIGMLAYIHAQRALSDNLTRDADRYLDIYLKADPLNPDQRFLRACYWMKTGDTGKAIHSLKEAAGLGFYDCLKIEEEPLFTTIKNNPAFRAILADVQKNADTKN